MKVIPRRIARLPLVARMGVFVGLAALIMASNSIVTIDAGRRADAAAERLARHELPALELFDRCVDHFQRLSAGFVDVVESNDAQALDGLQIEVQDLAASLDSIGVVLDDTSVVAPLRRRALKYAAQATHVARRYLDTHDLGVVGADLGRLAETARNLRQDIAAMHAWIHRRAVERTEQVRRLSRRTRLVSVTGLLAALGVSAILMGVLVVTVVRPVDRAIARLRRSAAKVRESAVSIARAGRDLAEGATAQATGLELAVAALHEMTERARRNAERTREAGTRSDRVMDEASSSQDAVGRMARAIERIRSAASETERIVSSIDEIAFQTNLLALNAAVEAARAGDAGRGFSVVAEEVRSLAQRSAEAARTSADLLGQSRASAEDGVRVSEEVSKILRAVTGDVRDVAEVIREFTSAIDEQRRGMERIHRAVADVDRIVRTNATTAVESARTGERLNGATRELDEAVRSLLTVVSGE